MNAVKPKTRKQIQPGELQPADFSFIWITIASEDDFMHGNTGVKPMTVTELSSVHKAIRTAKAMYEYR